MSGSLIRPNLRSGVLFLRHGAGLCCDWPKNNRALGASLRLVTELQIILLVNWLTADEIMAAKKDLNTSDV